jgi:arylsulfatase A-like enzyme
VKLASALVDAAAVTAAWAGALLAENAAIGFLWREQFLGPWEISLARHSAVPIAFAALAPVSLLVVGAWMLAQRAANGGRREQRALAVVGALAGGALAVGVSEGRHFANWGLRAPFVGALVLAGGAAGLWLVPRVATIRAPLGLGVLGLVLGVAAWLADSYVLPRLYPAFHVAMLVASLLGVALAALAGRAGAGEPGRVARTLACGVALLAVGCIVALPRAALALERAANLRIVLVEHAPFAGRAVATTMAIRPPLEDAPMTSSSTLAAGEGAREVARSLEWGGHDLLLVSVDALRADHVSAYGYPRPTTPNIDALAREGTLFERAYCATPHTSYSLTSIMTGKYLRPLLAMGQGEDSETWAQELRRYGWRTAAFYPPAVFFIDQERFARFEDNHLGFEYAKVEFADPELRERQVREYLDSAPTDRPLFLWVHFFEPHEPYVVHEGHVFSGGPSADVDAYDSEVAEADDGIGRIVRLMRTRRADPVIAVTADHGEEFGEHGGRYHGTTVYEEQVRVPLIVVGPGVRKGATVSPVAQTIDLLPTALSALGIPRPARLRGRDLGPVLAGATNAGAVHEDEGLALVETDDYELLASGADRLVCQRRAAACALYRPAEEPGERRDFGPQAPDRLQALQALLRATVRDHGRYEAASASAWPEAIRRGLQGEVDAAVDVASLLEDADPAIRRKAAEVSFALNAPAALPEIKRAMARDEDDVVHRWVALAVARSGEPLPPVAAALLRDPSVDWRRRAALALAERGDARACDEIATWWSDALLAAQDAGADGEPPRLAIDLRSTRELLAATAKARCRNAVPVVLRVLDDVRARPYAADTLGALEDDRARGPLLGLLAAEPYVTTRPHEARALLALGVHDWASVSPVPEVRTTLTVPSGPVHLAVLLSDGDARLEATADGVAGSGGGEGEVRLIDFAPLAGAGRLAGRRLVLEVHASAGGLLAIWLIPSSRLD